MLKKIAGVLVVLLVGLAAFVATRPEDFRISRSRAVAASPDGVHAYVNDFHNWPRWSPWEKTGQPRGRGRRRAPGAIGKGADSIGARA